MLLHKRARRAVPRDYLKTFVAVADTQHAQYILSICQERPRIPGHFHARHRSGSVGTAVPVTEYHSPEVQG